MLFNKNGKQIDKYKEVLSTGTHNKLKILFFDLTFCPRKTQFIALTTSVFVFFLLYGYVQEKMFKNPKFRDYTWYLTMIQFLFYTLFGFIETRLRNQRKRHIPIKTYLMLSLLTVVTMGLGNASVGYLNYPTQVMFKCCKLIPVMIGGIFIQNKRYNMYDVSACCCMTLGLIFFTLADQKVQPNFDHLGVILVCGSLCSDAVIGNVQEKKMKLHQASNYEVVLYSYGIGFIYILMGQILFDRPIEAFNFWLENPIETYFYAFIFSVTGYFGLNIVLDLVKNFGALLAVTITTCRKAVTIVLSFMFFAKPFTIQYVWSGLLVIIGIYLNFLSKNRDMLNYVSLVRYISKIIFKFKKSTLSMAEIV